MRYDVVRSRPADIIRCRKEDLGYSEDDDHTECGVEAWIDLDSPGEKCPHGAIKSVLYARFCQHVNNVPGIRPLKDQKVRRPNLTYREISSWLSILNPSPVSTEEAQSVSSTCKAIAENPRGRISRG